MTEFNVTIPTLAQLGPDNAAMIWFVMAMGSLEFLHWMFT